MYNTLTSNSWSNKLQKTNQSPLEKFRIQVDEFWVGVELISMLILRWIRPAVHTKRFASCWTWKLRRLVVLVTKLSNAYIFPHKIFETRQIWKFDELLLVSCLHYNFQFSDALES